MKRISKHEISAADIADYLAKRDDFSLELYVYNLAKRIGLNATHGGSYVDQVSGKKRQYDIRASCSKDSFRIDFAIECKSLRTSNPLLLSRIARSSDESFHQFIFSHKPRKINYVIHPAGLPQDVATVSGANSLYPPGELVGKSTAQVGKNSEGEFLSSDGEVYDKWSQALASANDLVIKAVNRYKESPGGVCCTLILPVLVVSDETLWVADYSDDGELLADPQKVDEAQLYVGHEYCQPRLVTYVASHLHVCTKSGILKLFERAVHGEAFYERVFPHEAIRLVLTGNTDTP